MEPCVRTVADLIAEVRAAGERMSRANPNRAVLAECEMALTQLAQQLADARAVLERQERGRVPNWQGRLS